MSDTSRRKKDRGDPDIKRFSRARYKGGLRRRRWSWWKKTLAGIGFMAALSGVSASFATLYKVSKAPVVRCAQTENLPEPLEGMQSDLASFAEDFRHVREVLPTGGSYLSPSVISHLLSVNNERKILSKRIKSSGKISPEFSKQLDQLEQDLNSAEAFRRWLENRGITTGPQEQQMIDNWLTGNEKWIAVMTQALSSAAIKGRGASENKDFLLT